MATIKDVVNAVFRDLMKKQKEVDAPRAAAAFKKIVGPKAFAHTRIVYLTKDKIRVNVDNSTWLYELNVRKERIQKELNKSLKIEDLKFRLGSIGEDHGRG
jgi:predicted nucleic acid-binding Zn ribbon protein